jgi:hypothetical protein
VSSAVVAVGVEVWFEGAADGVGVGVRMAGSWAGRGWDASVDVSFAGSKADRGMASRLKG